MATIFLAHIKVYDPAIPGETTLYFSSANYVSGATNYPTGGAAHTYYEPCIKQPAIMRSDIFDRATTFGASKVSYGALELVNNDGGLDDFINYGIDGRSAVLLIGEMTEGAANPTWTTILTGTMEQPEVSWDRVSIRLRDRQALLDVKISANTYAGSNSLPNGLEGVEGDLKGKRKPICYGQVFNISPPLVNTAKLIYQVNDGAISTVDAVYDKGDVITKGSDYTSESDMTTNAPTAGYYRVYPAGGFFRLGASPLGEVTADVTQGAAASNRTVAQILKSIAIDKAGIASGDITSADVTALDSANSAVVGAWVFDESKCKDVMDDIATSIGAWYGFDRLGKLRMGRFAAPSGTAVATITADDIIRIDRTVSKDEGRGVAIWKAKLNYKRFYTTQTSDIAGVVTAARRAELALDYRSVEDSDSSIKTKHLLAPEIEFNTLLVSASDAATEVTRRLSLYKADRSMYEMRIAMDSSTIATINLGDIITIDFERFGMSGGVDFVVIGLRPNLQMKLIDITVWG